MKKISTAAAHGMEKIEGQKLTIVRVGVVDDCLEVGNLFFRDDHRIAPGHGESVKMGETHGNTEFDCTACSFGRQRSDTSGT